MTELCLSRGGTAAFPYEEAANHKEAARARMERDCHCTAYTFAALAATLLLTASLGCRARDMGVPTASSASESVDPTWVAATRSCWPELEHDGYSVAGIKHNLADPLRFRSTFPSYASQEETSLRSLVTKPVPAAPTPDSSVLMNSRTPVLTRGQAITGADAHNALAQTTDGVAPPDALCAVHAGTPVGFK